MLKIDMHSHILPKICQDWEKKFGYGGFIKLDHHKPKMAKMMLGNKFLEKSITIVGTLK